MADIANKDAEFRAIRSIVGRKAIGSRILGGVDEACFHSKQARTFYNRIVKLLEKNGDIPTWNDLMEDSVIPSQYRELYAEKAKEFKPLKKLNNARKLVKRLVGYRQLRQAGELAGWIAQQLDSEEVDPEKVLNGIGDHMLKMRTSTHAEESFVHIGKNANYEKRLRAILRGETLQRIATGIGPYDRKNIGFPRGGLVICGGTTGGGKSVLGGMLRKNVARQGLKAIHIQLEMDEDETLQRDVADIADVDMGRLLDPSKRLTDEDRGRIIKMFRKHSDRTAEKGGQETVYSPTEDHTIEELLLMLKPYKYDMIIIDYLGLLKGMVEDERQWQKMGAAARFAKNFAKNNKCFVGSQRIFTKEYGLVSLKSIVDEKVSVWTRSGWKKATILCHGKQDIQKVTMVPAIKRNNFGGNGFNYCVSGRSSFSQSVTCTPDHRWILENGSITKSLKIGDLVKAQTFEGLNKESEDYKEGLRHGLIFGDGNNEGYMPTKGHYRHKIHLIGAKERFAYLFSNFRNSSEYILATHNSDEDLKKLPTKGHSAEYIAGFVEGWVATDGTTCRNTRALDSQDSEALDWLIANAPYGGWIVTGRSKSSIMETNVGKRANPIERVTLQPATNMAWKVTEIEDLNRQAKVYCPSVPGEKSFMLESGIYTGNCVVVLFVQINLEGIIRYSQAVKEHASVMLTWVRDQKARDTNIIEIVQQKSRNEEGFSFYLKTVFPNMRFEELDDKELAEYKQLVDEKGGGGKFKKGNKERDDDKVKAVGDKKYTPPKERPGERKRFVI